MNTIKFKIKLKSILSWFKQLFSYRIMLYRKYPATVGPDNVCKIGHYGKYLFLLTPDGIVLPKQLNIKVIDRINKPSRAIVELYVDLREIQKIEV
jgi:hypothetical protein